MQIAESPEKQAIIELLEVIDIFVNHWLGGPPLSETEVEIMYEKYAFARSLVDAKS